MRYPTVKTLHPVFGDNAKRARAILKMTRGQLMEIPECKALQNRAYGRLPIYVLKLESLNRLAETHGVESIEHRTKGYLEYLNTGDSYALTLIRFNGQYRVASLGDLVERDAGFM